MAKIKWAAKPPLNTNEQKALLQQYFELAKIDADGRVSWSSFQFDEYQLALLGCLQFPELPYDCKRTCIWNASNACVKQGNFSSDYFLEALNNQLSRFLSQDLKAGTVLTKFACQRPAKTVKVQVDRSAVTIYASAPSAFDVTSFKNDETISPQKPSHYTYASVSVAGRTVMDQLDFGLRELGLLSGVLNLSKTIGRRTLFTTHGNGLPLREMSFGQFFVLYDENKVRFERLYRFSHPRDLVDDVVGRDEGIKLLDQAGKIFRKMKKHPLRDDLHASILLYQSGLEAYDIDSALSRLWSALEKITYARHGQNTARRVAGMFIDWEIALAQLSAISAYRNNGVHHGKEDEFGLIMVQSCKYYFERMFLFVLRNKMKFKTREEVDEFLMAGADPNIAKKVELLKRRMKFNKPSDRKRGTGSA